MACSNTNILPNGGFKGLSPWKGHGIRLVPNPIWAGDTSVRMEKGSLLYQNVSGRFDPRCSYYLYFRVYHPNPGQPSPKLLVSVAYLDNRKHLIRSTPLLLNVPHKRPSRFISYFTIVPRPPVSTRYVSVIFISRQGTVLVDYISVVARDVKADSGGQT